MDLLSAITIGDRRELEALLSDDVVFRSPSTIYRGREQVVDLLALAIIEDLAPSREPIAITDAETITFITGHVDSDELDGVLIQARGGDGRIAEITMFLRPLGALQKVLQRIARAITESGHS
jgi:hypothetical protein